MRRRHFLLRRLPPARPGEQLAAQEMLAAQIVAAGMLFPFLLRNWTATLLLIATAALVIYLRFVR